MSKLVRGFGVNDADYVVTSGVGTNRKMCPDYAAWRDMLTRQTPTYWEKNPTYIGVKVCEEWRSFMAFRKWMVAQSWEGKQLDKDLLGDGKLYSPKTCVFVTSQVNTFTIDSGAARGEFPIGVSRDGKRFRADCRGATPRYLGAFDTPEEAHQAWRKMKVFLAEQIISTLTCSRTVLGLQRYIASI